MQTSKCQLGTPPTGKFSAYFNWRLQVLTYLWQVFSQVWSRLHQVLNDSFRQNYMLWLMQNFLKVIVVQHWEWVHNTFLFDLERKRFCFFEQCSWKDQKFYTGAFRVNLALTCINTYYFRLLIEKLQLLWYGSRTISGLKGQNWKVPK